MDSEQLDLFDRALSEMDPTTTFLTEHDSATRGDRAARLDFVTYELPDYSFMFSVEMRYLLEEARSTYVNGEYAATILIAQSFVEHWLMPHALKMAGPKALRWGLAAMVGFFRESRLLHPFLLDHIDRLRKLRNPFVHPKPGDPHTIDRRSLDQRQDMHSLMHHDARNALGLMYAVVGHVGSA